MSIIPTTTVDLSHLEGKLITVAEVASLYGISRKTVSRYISNGTLKTERIGQKRFVYKDSTIGVFNKPRMGKPIYKDTRPSTTNSPVNSNLADDSIVKNGTISLLEIVKSENEFLREQVRKKDEQLETKDKQIESLLQNSQAHAVLLKGIQDRLPYSQNQSQQDQEESQPEIEIQPRAKKRGLLSRIFWADDYSDSDSQYGHS